MKFISSLILAVIAFSIGALAQRSRMCFIAGLRDFIFVRDRELLKGLFTFLATIWILSSVLYGTGIISDGIPAPLFDEINTIKQDDATAVDNTFVPEIGTTLSNFEVAAYELQLKLVGTGVIVSRFMLVSIFGGLLLGLITTASGGCALRQHVLAAQGNGDAVLFIAGFYSMVIIYDLFLKGVINEWL